jgi:hypothetical protein
MKKLPPRYNHIVVPLLLTFLMTAIVAAISTAIAVGPNWTALRIWPGAWMASWAIAFPAALVILPLSRWLAAFIVQRPK